MFAYKIPDSDIRRIIINDKSDQFKIIFNIKNTENHDENILIEKHNQIIIKTTINKARIISKTIDDIYSTDPTLNQFEFELQNDFSMKIEEIVEIFTLIIKSTENEVNIPENKRDIFTSILNVLSEENAFIADQIQIQSFNQNIDTNQNQNQQNQKNDVNIFKCDFEGDELSGIISCIRQMDGPDGKDGVKLYTSGTEDPNHPLTNIIKYDNDHKNDYYYNFMLPIKKDDGWIEFDFGNRKINVASYTIRTNENQENSYHPKTWQLIGSNDHKRWEMIDLRGNASELNGRYKQYRFVCEKNNEFYRYIKYVELENYLSNFYPNSICLTCIEFFGSIFSP